MRKSKIEENDWRGVFPVPPLARKRDAARTLNWTENQKIFDHIRKGGLTRFMYGGNAFLYHITLREYEDLLGWLNGQAEDCWCIPSAGPSYGRLIDQAGLLKKFSFPAVMHLPSGDPRDAAGLERGLREFSQAAGTPLIVYAKEETSLGADKKAGLEAVARLVKDGVCIGIKYAVVRDNPLDDWYLKSLLERVPLHTVISGIGERPAIVHLRDFKLYGYTTGSGCIGSAWTQKLFEACVAGKWQEAEKIREKFMPLEGMRDAQGPARVLHAATRVARIAETGAIPPFITELDRSFDAKLGEAVGRLLME
jgi:dihydrodipicolinate synthase/N-acetylneuraminate lyase